MAIVAYIALGVGAAPTMTFVSRHFAITSINPLLQAHYSYDTIALPYVKTAYP